jgi:hypothetical protein
LRVGLARAKELASRERRVTRIPDGELCGWTSPDEERRATGGENGPGDVLDLSVVAVIVDPDADVRQPENIRAPSLGIRLLDALVGNPDIEWVRIAEPESRWQVNRQGFPLSLGGWSRRQGQFPIRGQNGFHDAVCLRCCQYYGPSDRSRWFRRS